MKETPLLLFWTNSERFKILNHSPTYFIYNFIVWKIQTNQATEKAQKKTSKDAENDYEASELLLYQAKILSEGNQKEEARVFLIDNESDILDKVARLEALSQVTFDHYFSSYILMLLILTFFWLKFLGIKLLKSTTQIVKLPIYYKLKLRDSWVMRYNTFDFSLRTF